MLLSQYFYLSKELHQWKEIKWMTVWQYTFWCSIGKYYPTGRGVNFGRAQQVVPMAQCSSWAGFPKQRLKINESFWPSLVWPIDQVGSTCYAFWTFLMISFVKSWTGMGYRKTRPSRQLGWPNPLLCFGQMG